MCSSRTARLTQTLVFMFLVLCTAMTVTADDSEQSSPWPAAGPMRAKTESGMSEDPFLRTAPPSTTPPISVLPHGKVPAAVAGGVQPASHMDGVPTLAAMESAEDPDIYTLEEMRELFKQKDAKTDDSSLYGRGMTLVLDEKGKKYIRFLFWNQAVANFTDNNPGTVDSYGELEESALDIGLRRSRFLAYSQLNEKYLILMHMGINNQTFTNGGGSGTQGIGGYGAGKKPQIFIHDVWSEYTVVAPSDSRDFSLAMGAGLHYWNGVSRKSSASTLGFMTVDAPVFNWTNIELTDQFGRQLGWYAKGKYGRLDYRFSVNHPFNADNRGALNNEQAVNIAADTLSYAGYFELQLWDQESNLLPYKTSTWLGQKSVFNLGAGFYFQPDASGILDGNEQLRKQDHLAVGIDCYYDRPVGPCGAAVTMYTAYYIFDYGDNYYRNVGIMNTGQLGDPAFLAANGITPTISGSGNAQPLMGTGEILYLEGGYLLPSTVFDPSHGKLQLFGAFTHKNLEWLDDAAFNWDIGINYLIDGHRAKLTFQYSLRPRFIEQTVGADVQRISDGSAGELIIQAQVAL